MIILPVCELHRRGATGMPPFVSLPRVGKNLKILGASRTFVAAALRALPAGDPPTRHAADRPDGTNAVRYTKPYPFDPNRVLTMALHSTYRLIPDMTSREWMFLALALVSGLAGIAAWIAKIFWTKQEIAAFSVLVRNASDVERHIGSTFDGEIRREIGSRQTYLFYLDDFVRGNTKLLAIAPELLEHFEGANLIRILDDTGWRQKIESVDGLHISWNLNGHADSREIRPNPNKTRWILAGRRPWLVRAEQTPDADPGPFDQDVYFDFDAADGNAAVVPSSQGFELSVYTDQQLVDMLDEQHPGFRQNAEQS
ncbi:MAG: hypothetical protein ABIS27_00035 [Longimicrobiales bacterium]